MTCLYPHWSQRSTESCDSAFTGSKDYLCIQPSALEVSVNSKMCDPCISCRVVMYMFTAGARNDRSFNVNLTCHIEGTIHCHARPLLLYLSMPYSQVSDHSVTDGLTKTMLLIGTPLVVTCWRNFIHSWRSSRCNS